MGSSQEWFRMGSAPIIVIVIVIPIHPMLSTKRKPFCFQLTMRLEKDHNLKCNCKMVLIITEQE